MSEFSDTIVVAITRDGGNRDEAERIIRTAAGVIHSGFDYLVVDSGSMPETTKALESLGVKVVKLAGKSVGNAIVQSMLEGAKEKRKFVIYTEGDKEYFPSQLPKLVAKMREGCDFAVPSRTHANMKNFAAVRRWEERMFSLMESAVARHYADFIYGPRAFRTETIAPLLKDFPKNLGWEITGFLPSKAAFLGLKIGSVKIRAPPMEHETSEKLKGAVKFRIMKQFVPVLRGMKLAAKTSGLRGMGLWRRPTRK